MARQFQVKASQFNFSQRDLERKFWGETLGMIEMFVVEGMNAKVDSVEVEGLAGKQNISRMNRMGYAL